MPCLCPPGTPCTLSSPGPDLAWKAIYTVILPAPTAVKVNGIPVWLHHSRLKAEKAEWMVQASPDPLNETLAFIRTLIFLIMTVQGNLYRSGPQWNWELKNRILGAVLRSVTTKGIEKPVFSLYLCDLMRGTMGTDGITED
ncbi:uncharacterized protein WM277_021798 [Molossus nigricans]